MDFFDFTFPAGNEYAAPPPLGEAEFDSGDYNICYPFGFMNDSEGFPAKAEED
jgi:hypothetical protein